jgi:citrate synthase
VRAFVDAMQLAGGEKPAVDSGLVAIAAALGLPRGGATALMGMGRIAGWVAHAMEQRHAAVQLRPRARYRPTSETNVPV